ncbi:MAG: hypothetical protein ACRC3B_22635 [Bacteroidia bacterium]
MKNTMIGAVSLCLLAAACKKEEEQIIPQPQNPPVTQSVAYFPLDSGSYWVYDTWQIDTLNNETYVSSDTVWVLGDSIIRGNTYSVIMSNNNQFTIPRGLFRDSANCIVNSNGDIYFSVSMLGQEIDVDSIWSGNTLYIVIRDSMDNGTHTVALNSGSYTTYQKSMNYSFAFPASIVQPHAPYHTNFAQGIGLVRSQYVYSTNPAFLYERRLVSYHIE